MPIATATATDPVSAANHVLANAGADLLALLSPAGRARLERTIAGHLAHRRDEPADRLAYRMRRAVVGLERSGGPGRLRDPAAWIAAVVTRRRGCAREDCEDGLLWWDRAACPACAERTADRARAKAAPTARGAAPARPAALPPLACCGVCERPFPRGTGPGICRACRAAPAPAPVDL